jgi:hypothetical protein
MQRPGSKTFHHWLTPEQISDQYGAAPEDVAKVTNWKASSGFHANSVSRARSIVQFSGTASQVTSTASGLTVTYQTVAGHIASYTMTASYSGDANYNPIAAVTAPYTEVQAATSIEAHAGASTVAVGGTVTGSRFHTLDPGPRLASQRPDHCLSLQSQQPIRFSRSFPVPPLLHVNPGRTFTRTSSAILVQHSGISMQ